MAKSRTAQHVITRDYQGLRGFSTESKYADPAYVAEIAVNIVRQTDETFGPRRGYQVTASNRGGLGSTTFQNPCLCKTENVSVGMDGSLYVIEENSMEITFTGASSANYVSYEIFVDPTTVSDPQDGNFNPYDVISPIALVNDRLKFRLYVDGSTTPTLDLDLGKGYGVSSPYPISSLITALNGVSGVSAVTTDDTSVPAAFIQVTELTNIANGQTVLVEWESWRLVNQTVPSPFAGLAAEIDNDEFINASFATYSQTLYICSQFDFPQKYDGQTVYRAGMPEGAIPEVDIDGAGALSGDYFYYITYQQNGRLIDEKETGIPIEGVLSAASDLIAPSAENVEVTYANLEAGSGWNTNCGIVSGDQVGVTTIVLDANNTLKAGDTAFFLDSSLVEHTREVLSATASSITIDGTAVSVLNGKAISNNLKVNIWRTKASGAIPYLVTTLPNNAFSATSIHIDSKVDTDLLIDFKTPERPPNPPPKCAYVSNYSNQLIYAGNVVNYQTPNAQPNEDVVYFSEGNSPEAVPQDPDISNSFLVPANNDSITGIGLSGSILIIFKNDSIYCVSGDLLTNQFNVDSIAPGSNIGCVAHATIASAHGVLYFTHTTGVYSIIGSNIYPTDKEGNAVPLSRGINIFFIFKPKSYDKRFQFIRATAINYTHDKQYILFLPCEADSSITDKPKFANTNSRVLCYDYEKKNWFEWTNINAAGGFMQVDNNLYFMDRRASPTGTSISNLYRQHRQYRLIDYVDHVTPIRVTWRSSWEHLDQPKVRKKFLRATLLFDDISTEQQTPNPVMKFRTYLDWISGIVSTIATISFANQTSPWSTSPWGFAPYDGYQDSFYTVNLKQGCVAKALKMELRMNKLNQKFNLRGFGLEIAPDFNLTVVR